MYKKTILTAMCVLATAPMLGNFTITKAEYLDGVSVIIQNDSNHWTSITKSIKKDGASIYVTMCSKDKNIVMSSSESEPELFDLILKEYEQQQKKLKEQQKTGTLVASIKQLTS